MSLAHRILVIAPGGADGRGGIGRHVRYVTRHLQDSESPWRLRVLNSYGQSPRQMPARFAWCMLFIIALAFRSRTTLVHVHMAADGSAVRKLALVCIAKLIGASVLLHVHGSRLADFYTELPSAAKALLRWSMSRADAVIALGAYWKRFLTSEIALDPLRVHVMPNAVPAGRAPKLIREDAQSCRILFLGRVGARKGVPTLLQALSLLLDARSDWRLICAGDGEIAPHAEMAARFGIADRVTFTGWVDEEDAAKLLASADLLVLPSKNEGLPMAILEAMAHGLPVISTPVGAISDVVIPGKTGLLAPVGDVDQLASALRQLIDCPEMRRRMGAAALDAFTKEYSIGPYCERLTSIYQRLLTHAEQPGQKTVR